MKKFLKREGKFLLIGTISIIPAVITIQVIIFVYQLFASLISEIHILTNSWVNTFMAIGFSLSFLILIGYSVVKHGSSGYVLLIDKVVLKIPLFNKIYSVIKKVLDLFFSDKEELSEVVFIEYPSKDIWVPAYVTNRVNSSYILFVPTSPNPTSGFTILIKEDKVIECKMTMEEATSFIVGIGVDLDSGKIREYITKIEEQI